VIPVVGLAQREIIQLGLRGEGRKAVDTAARK